MFDTQHRGSVAVQGIRHRKFHYSEETWKPAVNNKHIATMNREGTTRKASKDEYVCTADTMNEHD